MYKQVFLRQYYISLFGGTGEEQILLSPDQKESAVYS